jgi:hypothetical protein
MNFSETLIIKFSFESLAHIAAFGPIVVKFLYFSIYFQVI